MTYMLVGEVPMQFARTSIMLATRMLAPPVALLWTILAAHVRVVVAASAVMGSEQLQCSLELALID